MTHLHIQSLLSDIPGRNIPTSFNMEFEQVTLQQGNQTVKFKKAFLTSPAVVGSFTQASGAFQQVKFTPLSIQVGQVGLNPIKLARVALSAISLPRDTVDNVPTIPTLAPPTNQITPWGTTWANAVNGAVGNIPVLNIIGEGLGILLSIVGNAAYYAYYATSGDYSVIAKTVMSQTYSDLTNLLNTHIISKLNPIIDSIESNLNSAISGVQDAVNGELDADEAMLNSFITSTQTEINSELSSIEDTLNSMIQNLSTDFSTMVNVIPAVIMKAFGYTPDREGNYNLPIPVNITNITETGFDIYVPQGELTLNYIAVST
jgi:hypothetical protein